MPFDDLSYVGMGNNRRFDDPFLLPSSASMPETLETALDMCLFLYYMNPQYVQASARVARHFITDFDYPGDGAKQEKDDLDDFLHYQLQLPGFMTELGDEWACFSGETKVITRDGVFEIKGLEGMRVDVLSKGGVYRPADFKCYGVQPLMEVTFTDGRKVYATPEHKWEVLNNVDKVVEVTTTQLRKGYKIERTVAPRPEMNDEYREGIRHGFIFGDGSLSSRNKRSTAMFCGAKDLALLPYFAGLGNTVRPRQDRKEMLRQSGFPAEYKSLPDRDRSASYWYGFVSGFLAAYGSVDTYGCAILTQRNKRVLDSIVEQLPRIGMCAGPVRGHRSWHKFTNCHTDGSELHVNNTMHYATLLKRFMLPQDFLIPAHREKFVKNFKGGEYGRYISIKAVKKTERVEPVYCCVEMETHRIVLDNGILTGQCYGNGFGRIHFPFDRFLIDDRTRSVYALDFFGRQAKYHYQSMTYSVPDPLHPGRRVSMRFRDQRSRDASRIRMVRLNPRLVTIRHNIISMSSEYIYRFDPEFVSDVKKGRLYVVNETPMRMLQAIKNNHDFAFDGDTVFHLKAPTVSGISNAGWGIPGTIANFRNLHQLQVYRKIDEAVGLDYMLPFRLFSPTPSGNGGSQMFDMMLSSQWAGEVKKIISNRRRDKFAMHALPFPVNYQEFGAEGKTLTPKDMMEFQTGALLDGMGYPQELFKGSLTWMQVPTAMRLFENSFMFLHMGFNNLSGWACRRIRAYLNQPQMKVTLQRPSMADSLERKQLVFQLGAMGEISRETAYNSLGIDDVVGEMKKRMEEDMEIQREQMKMQQSFQREVETGSLMAPEEQPGMSGGSQPGGSTAGTTTPTDTQAQAQSLAQYWLSIPSDGERRQAMSAVRNQSPSLYALAKETLSQMRSQGGSQGRQQVEQQAQQQGGSQ